MANDRDDLKRELRLVRESLNEYTKQTKKDQSRRRAENIQVLTSLGILGGFISLYVQNSINSSPYSSVIWLLSISSAGFVLSKTLLPPLRQLELFDRDTIEKFDLLWMQLLYTFLISLSVISLLAISLSRIDINLERGVTAINDESSIIQIISIVLSIISTYLIYNSYSKSYEKEREDRVKFEEIIDESYSEMQVLDLLTEDSPIWEEIGVESIEEREFRLGNLRPDFLARGEEGNPIIVELTTRRVDPDKIERVKEYVRQFERQYGEENIEAIILAPGISDNSQILVDNDDRIEYVEFEIEAD